jgi:hypothetical protein
MRAFELRVYKLRTKEALDFYMEQVYPVISAAFRGGGWLPRMSKAGRVWRCFAGIGNRLNPNLPRVKHCSPISSLCFLSHHLRGEF